MIAEAPKGSTATNDNAALESGVEGLKSQAICKTKSRRKETKLERILRIFFEGAKWNFQTIREHGDSCLHSTVSSLRHLYGVEIDDEPHTVRGFAGNKTRCKQYWLRRDADNLKRVRGILGMPEEVTQ